MQIRLYRSNGNWINITIALLKILIISFVGIWFIGNFEPYYLGADSFVYGVTTVGIANGTFGFTNELLQDSGAWEFVPYQWSKTIHNNLIPIGDVGIYGFSTISYLIGGYYGLFYLGPILSIVFLIVFERITTNLFGRVVGLLALVFVAMDFNFIFIGEQLRNELVFTIFFVFGIFYLVKFLDQRNDKLIFLSSVFFAVASIIRINGVILFPVEILLVAGYFIFKKIYSNKDSNHKNNSFDKKTTKIRIPRIFKISFLLVAPWILYLLFIMSYNSYFYNDPFTNYFDERPYPEDYITASKLSIFEFDINRLNWISFYSVSIIPDTLKNMILNNVLLDSEDFFGDNSLSIFSSLILISALAISLRYKIKRVEIIVLIFFILSFFIFFSPSYLHSTMLNTNEIEPSLYSRDRYMLPILPLSMMVFGFLIHSIWKIGLCKIPRNFLMGSKILKTSFVLIIILFGFAIVLDSTPIEALKISKFEFKDPMLFASRYPLDMEGLSKQDSIIIEGKRFGIEYDAVSFYPFWGYYPKLLYEFDSASLPQEPIQRIKKLMDNGYNVYAFKHRFDFETKYFQYLEKGHDLVLKNHSDLFCKLEKSSVNNSSNEKLKHDLECYPVYGYRKVATLEKFMIKDDAEKFDQTLNFPREVRIEYRNFSSINNETTPEDQSPSRPTSYNFTINIDDILEEIP